MRISKITIVLFVLACSTAPLRAQHMEISPKESRPSAPGPAETFTGTVSVTPLFSATDTTRSRRAQVMFEPGARSAWHTRPGGQTLLVISGAGCVQEWNAPKREMKTGGGIWTRPSV